MAIQLDLAFAPAHTNRGIVWCRLGEYDNAVRDLGEAIRLDPHDPEAYRNRGGAWGAKGDYRRAISDFDEAIRIDSSDALAYDNRASARSETGDYDGALKDYGQAIRLDPKDADAYAARGSVWAAQAKYDNARARLSRSRCGSIRRCGGLQQFGLARGDLPRREISRWKKGGRKRHAGLPTEPVERLSPTRYPGRCLCRGGRL